MTFAGFDPLFLLGGGALLAGVLFALQQLRVRRRTLQLPAAMLWAQAVREVPASALRERFRHWRAYLLSLAIVLLLLLAAGMPRPVLENGNRRQVFYFDDSAALSAKGTFAAARRALLADLAQVPDDRREVRGGGPTGDTLLLAPGEPLALLAHRLDGAGAHRVPSRFSSWVRTAPADADLHYYGGPIGLSAASATADGATISYGYVAPSVADNRGIVNLGVSPAASGATGKADLLVETVAARGPAPDARDMVFTRSDAPFTPERVEVPRPGLTIVRDLPADGREIGVALRRNDAFPVDDAAVIRVPDRRPIPIALRPAVPDAIRAVIAADAGLAISDAAHARVLVRTASEPAHADLPELVLTSAAQGGDSFALGWPGASANDARALAAHTRAMGLSDLDTAALAEGLHGPVTLGFDASPTRRLQVWREVLALPDMRQSNALPLLVARSLRWLAAPDPWIASARAGAAPNLSADEGGLNDGEALGAPAILGEAGSDRPGTPSGAAALLDRETSLAAARPSTTALSHPGGAFPADWFYLLLCLGAAALLGAEWVLYRKGWMP